jgi:hypothetical protein
MALTSIEKIRYELADTDPSFPLLTDSEYEYFLEKNYDSIPKATLDAAKTILFKLSMRSDSTIDIFSLKNSRAAVEYRMALQLFIKDSSLNPVMQNVRSYFGGVSNSDMLANDSDPDNNILPFSEPLKPYKPFGI